MTEEELVEKINDLSRKSKERKLSDDEKNLQQELRSEYIKRIKGSLKGHLDSIKKK